MALYKLEVTHTGRYTRRIIMEVEADTGQAAIDKIEEGDVDVPDFDDKRWTVKHDLQNEVIEFT